MWTVKRGSVALALSTFALYCIWRRLKRRNLPPGPKGWPILGNLLELGARSKDSHIYFQELSEIYGPIYTIWLGSHPCIVISDLDLVKEALLSNQEIFSDRPTWLYVIQRLKLDQGGITNRGYGLNWRVLRRFGMQALRDFGVGKKSLEERVVDECEILIREIESKNGEPFDPQLTLNLAVSNIIAGICLGERSDYNDKRFQERIMNLKSGFQESRQKGALLNFVPFVRYIPFMKRLYEPVAASFWKSRSWITETIENHRPTFDASNIRDLIDLYLENETDPNIGFTTSRSNSVLQRTLSRQNSNQSEAEKSFSFSNTDMHILISDFFIAGTDTTANALQWLLLYLVKYPEVQRHCHDEIDLVLGSQQVSESHRADLVFVEATIHEILRIANIVPQAVPHNCRRACMLANYVIPKNSLVLINVMGIHLNERYWKNPTEFWPHRWIKSGKFVGKRDGFLPFGMGQRACPGESLAKMEIFLFFTTLLQRFSFCLPENDSDVKLLGINGITNAPQNFRIKAKVR